MSDFLETLARASAARGARVSPFVSGDFDKPVVPLALNAFDIIAEIKDRSPAEGLLGKGDGHRNARAEAYAAGDAAAISVLT